MGGEQEHYRTIAEGSAEARAALAHPLTNTGSSLAKALRTAPHRASAPRARLLREMMGDAVEKVCGAAVEILQTEEAELDH